MNSFLIKGLDEGGRGGKAEGSKFVACSIYRSYNFIKEYTPKGTLFAFMALGILLKAKNGYLACNKLRLIPPNLDN